MIQVAFSEEIKRVCPELEVVSITCDVINSESNELLWQEVAAFEQSFREQYKMEDIKKILPIRANREAYKKLGKDPNRYRPSSESLCRRILRGLSLYHINTLVDVVNLVSLKSGFSIGAFDFGKIDGDRLELGVGKECEPYEGIGRGRLNIAGLPVYRDRTGGIGTPTSDEERTKIELSTTRLLMIINDYASESDALKTTTDYACEVLRKYVSAENIQIARFLPRE